MTRPLIIIGAPRSGTNALRDALCALPQFHTWPCDELNPLWRTGNTTEPTDELTPAHARPEVVKRIQHAFDKRAGHQNAVLVEKTCANSLRPAFVNKVIPDAAFVEIVRDGRDAASSAAERWGASFDLMYTLRKLRFVPKGDLATVAAKQLSQRLHRSGAPERATVQTWGPRFAALDQLIHDNSPLEQICAAQWSACVTAGADFFDSNPGIPAIRIRYEDFVESPVLTLSKICEYVGVTSTAPALENAGASIHSGSVGRWTKTPLATSPTALETLEPALVRLGYEPTPTTSTHEDG